MYVVYIIFYVTVHKAVVELDIRVCDKRAIFCNAFVNKSYPVRKGKYRKLGITAVFVKGLLRFYAVTRVALAVVGKVGKVKLGEVGAQRRAVVFYSLRFTAGNSGKSPAVTEFVL